MNIPDWTYGYDALERAEQAAAAHATSHHYAYVAAWNWLLTSYYRALDVPNVRVEDDLWGTEWRILRLGIYAAKSALDQTLVGYYVGAFGAIRQLTEYWFGLAYLRLNPESVAGFYAADQGEAQVHLLPMGQRIRWVRDAFADGGAHADAEHARVAEVIYPTYSRMSDGHHLDGLAIVQTGAPTDPGYYLGAGYHLSLVLEAFHHGTFLTGFLAREAVGVMAHRITNGAALIAELDAAMHAALEQ